MAQPLNQVMCEWHVYTKKPIKVQATQVKVPVEITTIDGNTLVVSPPDYIVIDLKGYPYPCNKELFKIMHEIVPTSQEEKNWGC